MFMAVDDRASPRRGAGGKDPGPRGVSVGRGERGAEVPAPRSTRRPEPSDRVRNSTVEREVEAAGGERQPGGIHVSLNPPALVVRLPSQGHHDTQATTSGRFQDRRRHHGRLITRCGR